MRAGLAAGALALATLWPPAAQAKPSARIDGGTVFFYNDSLALVVRGGVTMHLASGAVVTGDAAYVDLRADRATVAGDARLVRGATAVSADALAFDLPGDHVAELRVASGVSGGTGDLFAFPDLADRTAYIRARHADVVSKTSVRLRPAAFPTSSAAPPVPMYLYTFAAGSGFAATALSSASFDQPYGLFSTPNALTALHFRYLAGPGPSIGIAQNVIGSDRSFVAGAVDVPLHAALSEGLSGYQQVGENGTLTLAANATEGLRQSGLALTQAIGTLVGRLNYGITSTGASSAILSLRTRERDLGGGFTWHAAANFGFIAQDGGVYALAPNPAQVQTVWQRGLELFVASPLVRGPLGTSLSATVDASRTAYSYPHRSDVLEANVTGSRRLTRTLTIFFGYDARWAADVFPNAQTIFYPPNPAEPDFRGYVTGRLANVDLQYVQGAATSIRLSYRHADDFPQVNFVAGRPPNEVRADVRARVAPNIGLSFGRSYDFGWFGSRWVPGWNFSVFQ